MTCALCGEQTPSDFLNHIRLMHPDALDQKTADEILSLKPVTLAMHSDDWVCEKCDRQFVIGMLYGEMFEGMFGEYPITSLVCGKCFMEVT